MYRLRFYAAFRAISVPDRNALDILRCRRISAGLAFA